MIVKKSAVVWFLLSLFFTGYIYFNYRTDLDPNYAFLCACATGLSFYVTAIPLFRRLDAIPGETISFPIGAWAAISLLYWCVGTTVLLTVAGASRHDPSAEWIFIGQLSYAGSALLLIFGYKLTCSSKIQRQSRLTFWWPDHLMLAAIVLSKVGALGISGNMDGVGRTASQLSFFLNSFVFAAALITVVDRRRSKLVRVVVSVLLLDSLLGAVTSGSRMAVLHYAIIVAAIAIQVGQLKLTKARLLTGLAVLVFAVLVAQVTRQEFGYAASRAPEHDAAAVAESAVSRLLNRETATEAVNTVASSAMSERLAVNDVYAWVLEEIYSAQDYRYLLGESFLSGFIVIWLPSAVFPEKPLAVTAEGYLSTSIHPTKDTITSAQLEWVVNFGLLGPFIGMFLVGAFWGKIGAILLHRLRRCTSSAIIYVFLISAIVSLEREFMIYGLLFIRNACIVALIGLTVLIADRLMRTKSGDKV